ncbi:ABC transporter ATP-binding protein [Rhodococcus sp. WS4]|nr:ABC transporter ATP-binding protein [Rhodococcus sp. WS4]
MPEYQQESSAKQPALELRGVRKSFVTQRSILGRVTDRFDAVKGVDLTVAQGETLAVVGESGAGKSTVGRMALGLEQPDAGQVKLLGTDLARISGREMRRFRARAAMIFQDPFKSLDPHCTIRYSLHEPLLSQGMGNRDERDERVTSLLSQVGFPVERLDSYPYEMSGGQLQRVAIARSLTTEPDLIVCDEPVAALDMSIRAQVINLLRDIQVERNLAYLFVTHDLSLVRVIADRVAVMRRGEVVECRPVEELYEDPQHEYTRELLQAVPAPHPRNRRLLAGRPVAAAVS